MSRRALIVDDDGAWRDLLARVVERLGLTQDSASTSHRAIELVSRWSYCIALIDPRLGPNSSDYKEILAALKAKNSAVPTVLISGLENLHEIARAHRRNYYMAIYEFSKSEELPALERIVQELVGLPWAEYHRINLGKSPELEGIGHGTGSGYRKCNFDRSKLLGTRVLIGHGHSSEWLKLQAFIVERLDLPVDEFNRISTAGISTVARLSEMLDSAAIGFLVLTAEDEVVGGRLRARQNVVHEVGLCQGRLGFARAIVLLEDGCEEFSNIDGLGQIRFPKGNIGAAFEEVRRVLEREDLVPLRFA
jgi:CheY-like chemotaxis protein